MELPRAILWSSCNDVKFNTRNAFDFFNFFSRISCGYSSDSKNLKLIEIEGVDTKIFLRFKKKIFIIFWPSYDTLKVDFFRFSVKFTYFSNEFNHILPKYESIDFGVVSKNSKLRNDDQGITKTKGRKTINFFIPKTLKNSCFRNEKFKKMSSSHECSLFIQKFFITVCFLASGKVLRNSETVCRMYWLCSSFLVIRELYSSNKWTALSAASLTTRNSVTILEPI